MITAILMILCAALISFILSVCAAMFRVHQHMKYRLH